MNIAIEVNSLDGGHQYRGIGSYSRLLIDALKKYEQSHTYHLFRRGEAIPQNVDIVHYPYFDPFFLTLPLIKSKPVVVTVHDLIPLKYPEHFPRGLRGKVKWEIQKMSLSGATEIITDSKASESDIRSILGINDNKIHVVYLASSPVFKPVVRPELLAAIQKKYHLPKKFLLYVGDVNWNKNVEGLLESVANVRKHHPDIQLVLVGRSFLNTNLTEVKAINNAIERLGLKSIIHALGRIEDEELAALYTLAEIYVQPSFAEGFGLPVLEAMACHCKVVSSDASSLAEIAGPALQFDPHNIQSMVSSIEQALRLPRSTWISESGKWISRFTWQKTAYETVAVYEKSLEK
jgi:glycosyltransferase involved in cell wall biosynthesis